MVFFGLTESPLLLERGLMSSLKLTNLTETWIQDHCKNRIFERGQNYYKDDRVVSLQWIDDRIVADVEGSKLEPYRVSVKLDSKSVDRVDCTCPTSLPGMCKHAVAVLLTSLREPEQIDEGESLKDLIEQVDRSLLEEILMDLSKKEAEQKRLIRNRLQKKDSDDSGESEQSTIRPEDIRNRIYGLIHSLDRMKSSEAYWQVPEVVHDILEVVENVRSQLDSDSQNEVVLDALEEIVDVYVSEWLVLDGSSGDTARAYSEMSEALTEAYLSVELTDVERTKRANWVKEWQKELEGYGLARDLEPARLAAKNGCDIPEFEPIFGNTENSQTTLNMESPLHAILVPAYLSVLNRNDDTEAYRKLSRAAGEEGSVIDAYLEEEQIEEAIRWARDNLTLSKDTLPILKKLKSQGQTDEAVSIGMNVMAEASGGHRLGRLAEWLRDRCIEGKNRSDDALQAARVACQNKPSLSNYERLKELAGNQWTEIQRKVIEEIHDSTKYPLEGAIDVFLAEDEYDHALDALDSTNDFDLIREVCEESVSHCPERVKTIAQAQAEEIMDQGRSQAYFAAKKWLSLIKRADKKMDNEKAWNNYIEDLLEKHSRKYKLVPKLEELGRITD